MSSTHCYAVRDKLYALIDNAPDLTGLFAGCDAVLTVLEHTEGFWQAANYCYKAGEVSARAIAALRRYEETCQHRLRHEKIIRYKDKLLTMERRYRRLQEQMMQPSTAS